MELLDLIRVGLVLLITFLVLPLYATRAGDKWKQDWKDLATPVFIRTAFFFQISVIVLAQWKLCLPGLMAAVYFAWLILNAVFSYSSRWIYDPLQWKLLWARMLGRLERRTRQGAKRGSSISPKAVLTYVLIIFLVGRVAWFPLNNLRFFTQDSYNHALSLETLLQGGSWTYDGSLPLLMPAAFWSGLDAASVIRLCSPIILLALFMAVWNTNRMFGGSWRSTFLAISLYWVSTGMLQLSPGVENASRDLAALFFLLAAASLKTSYSYAGCSLLIGVLVNPNLDASLLCLLSSVFLGLAVDKMLRAIPLALAQPLTAVLVFATGLAAILAVEPKVAAEPLQYESAARAVYDIAAGFPRNQWSIISPSTELAQIYGRGWHIQLAGFTREHTPAQVRKAGFQFKYPTPHIFLFVEKKPLPVQAQSIASNGEEAAYLYGAKAGRISVEFQAAELMAAYLENHSNAEIFHEDDALVVYHIHR